jgi:DNA repair photolyase
MQTIYQPRGRAAEYAHLALELLRCDAHERGGCTHGCSYCYVPACLKITPGQFREGVRPREGVIQALRKAALKYAGTKERVLISFFSDPYQGGNTGWDDTSDDFVTRAALRILKTNQIPFSVLTKGGHRATEDFDMYSARDAFGATLTFPYDDKGHSHDYEPLAAKPRCRISTLEAAHRKGIYTWVSLEPVLDPEASLRIIEETHTFVDHYKLGKLNHKASYINWTQYAVFALERLDKYQKSYYIKADLAQHLREDLYHNTDDRRIP